MLIPLISLVMGVVTFGLAYSNHVALTNAVREGARLGASTVNDATWGASVVSQTVNIYADANSPLAPDHVCALLIKSTGGVTTTEQTSACDTTKAGPEPATPSSIPDGCFVKVWARKDFDVNWVFGHVPVTLGAESVSVYDRAQVCS